MKAILRWVALVLLAFARCSCSSCCASRRWRWSTRSPPPSSARKPWRIATEKHRLPWRQRWLPYERISDHLKRAVIAAEDDGFANHEGVDWDALEKAWERNAKAGTGGAPRSSALARAAAQDRGRLHHHAAAREEPAALRRAHAACARARNWC